MNGSKNADADSIVAAAREPSETECLPEKIRDSNVKFGEKDVEVFPEGGRGWWVLLGCAFLMNTNYGMVNSFGAYQVYYQQRYPDVSTSTISMIGSLQPAIIYLSCLPVIWLHNKVGTQISIVIGSSIMVFALMMLSLCNSIWQIYLTQGVLFGIGAGINYFTSMSVPPEWFKERRALAIGIITGGSSIGGVFWPIAIQRLIKEVGFGWANRIVAFIYIAELVVAALTVKNRLPHEAQRIMPKWSVALDWKFATLMIASCVGYFGLFPPIFYMEDFANRAPGVPENTAQYILTILNAFSFFGRVLPGFIADKCGRVNTLIPILFICGILPLVLWVPEKHGQALLLCFAIFWGAASGAFISLFPSCIGQLFGVKDLGSRLTLYFLTCIPGSFAGPGICGTFVNGTIGVVGFDKLGIFAGIVMLASAVMVLAVRISISRELRIFI